MAMIRLAAGLFAFLTLLPAQILPSGTPIQVRLRQTVSSFGTPHSTEIRAIVITPVELDGRIGIPLGAEIIGVVRDVRRVGLGFVHESAWVDLGFDALRLPGGPTVPIATRITKIDNARESINAKGRIQGIRATASLSSTLSGVAVSLTALDPMLLAFGLSSSLTTFRIPESEIRLPTGAELQLETTAPLSLTRTFPPAVAALPESGALAETIRRLPFRTATQGANQPSDLANLAFIGSEDALRKAFDAAGWSRPDARDARSTYYAMRSIIENQGYREAPMSTLLLNGKPPRTTYSKTLNTFFSRHHLRVFAAGDFNQQPLWTASSTHDSGIGFAVSQKTFIHVIDQDIDLERAKA